MNQQHQYLKSLGDFCQAVLAVDARKADLASLREREPVKKTIAGLKRKTAMGETTGAIGGYLVPLELQLDLTRLMEQKSPFYLNGYVQPMSTEQLSVPGVDIVAGNATGVSVLYGGFSASWGYENTALNESEPSFLGPKLVCRDLQCVAKISNQLVWDGGEALGAYLHRLFELALLWQTSYAFFQGDGSDQPLGLLKAPASVAVSRQTPSTVTTQDIATMAESIIPACYSRSVWAMNPSAYLKVAQLSQYLFSGHNIPTEDRQGQAGALLTRPLFLTDQLPKVGTPGDVVLFDPGMYCVGFRSLEISASDIPYFTTNQSVYRLLWRGDGQPLARKTVTLADGNTSAGISSYLQ